jgi:hypothetical protein
VFAVYVTSWFKSAAAPPRGSPDFSHLLNTILAPQASLWP